MITKHHELRLANAAPVATIFAALGRDGFFASTTGDGGTGALLTAHALVEHVHITGGLATAEKIVWGATPEERRRRKAEGAPALQKSITMELGNVSPFIVAPGGEWMDEDLRFQAAHLAAVFSGNNSCNCLSPKVLVLAAGWVHAAAFIEYLREELRQTKSWPPYYPGTHQRWQGVRDRYPEVGAG